MTFTKERIIEELKASTQNASGMFEITEDTICALMELLESRADAEPVTYDQAQRDHMKDILIHKMSSNLTSAVPLVMADIHAATMALMQAGFRVRPQPAPGTVQDEHYRQLSELYHAQEKRLFKLAQRIKGPSFDKYAYSPSQAIDVLETAIFGEKEDNGSACRAAMLQGKAEPKRLDAIDSNLVEALRLVQCMLEDYREKNYGDAEGWIRHINSLMSDYSEAHGDDAYSVLHELLPAAPQQEAES